MYADIDGKIEAINHVSGEKALVEFHTSGFRSSSKITGKCFDSRGNLKYEIHGSWLDQIYLKEIKTGYQETVWQELAPIEDYKKQFFFSRFTMLLNYKNDEMVGTIAPTDTRWRSDQRLWEEGQED